MTQSWINSNAIIYKRFQVWKNTFNTYSKSMLPDWWVILLVFWWEALTFCYFSAAIGLPSALHVRKKSHIFWDQIYCMGFLWWIRGKNESFNGNSCKRFCKTMTGIMISYIKNTWQYFDLSLWCNLCCTHCSTVGHPVNEYDCASKTADNILQW